LPRRLSLSTDLAAEQREAPPEQAVARHGERRDKPAESDHDDDDDDDDDDARARE